MLNLSTLLGFSASRSALGQGGSVVVDWGEHTAGWNLRGTEKRVRTEKLPIFRQSLLVTMLLGWSCSVSGCPHFLRNLSINRGGNAYSPYSSGTLVPDCSPPPMQLHWSSSWGYSSGHPSLPNSSRGLGGAGTLRWFENLSSNSSVTGTKPYKQGVQGE